MFRRMVIFCGVIVGAVCLAGCHDDPGPVVEYFDNVVAHDRQLHLPHVGVVNPQTIPRSNERDELARLYGLLSTGSAEQRKQDIDYACKAKDAVELGNAQSVQQALPPALSHCGASAASQTVAEANALDQDQNSKDVELELAAFATCQWAAS